VTLRTMVAAILGLLVVSGVAVLFGQKHTEAQATSTLQKPRADDDPLQLRIAALETKLRRLERPQTHSITIPAATASAALQDRPEQARTDAPHPTTVEEALEFSEQEFRDQRSYTPWAREMEVAGRSLGLQELESFVCRGDVCRIEATFETVAGAVEFFDKVEGSPLGLHNTVVRYPPTAGQRTSVMFVKPNRTHP
jgi:hypothetical protein